MKGKKIAIVGRGRAGKDTASEFFRDRFGLTYGGTTSVPISESIARKFKVPFEVAHALRHEFRDAWRVEGDRLRESDPAALARWALARGDLLTGVRSRGEILAAQAEGLIDLTIWVEKDVDEDSTLEFGPEVADIIIDNNSDVPTFHAKLARLARAMGLIERVA